MEELRQSNPQTLGISVGMDLHTYMYVIRPWDPCPRILSQRRNNTETLKHQQQQQHETAQPPPVTPSDSPTSSCTQQSSHESDLCHGRDNSPGDPCNLQKVPNDERNHRCNIHSSRPRATPMEPPVHASPRLLRARHRSNKGETRHQSQAHSLQLRHPRG